MGHRLVTAVILPVQLWRAFLQCISDIFARNQRRGKVLVTSALTRHGIISAPLGSLKGDSPVVDDAPKDYDRWPIGVVVQVNRGFKSAAAVN